MARDGDDTGPDGAYGDEAPVASVVIPAHNEEAVVGRLLDALTTSSRPGRLEVVVACNGCTDRTADVARRHGARVVEIPQASKIAALNAGDLAATAFPRAYVDADIIVTGATVERLAQALRQPGVHCVAPPMRVDTTGRPWAVRAFYDVWPQTPYMRDRHVGSGILAMSAEGRGRFDTWPDIIADDRYARALFSREERRVVGSDPFVIQAAHTVSALVRRRVRIHAGNMQVEADPELRRVLRGRDEPSGPWWRVVLERPALAPAAVAYATVNGAAKVGARRQMRAGGAIAWNRDDTTRTPASPEPGPTSAEASP